MKNSKIRNDILLAVTAILLTLIAFLAFKAFEREGSVVKITQGGELYGEYSLGDDRVITVESEYGYNVIVIENGEVLVESADCRDKICVQHRRIKNSGETIVCLPHKLVVSIEGETSDAPDVVS